MSKFNTLTRTELVKFENLLSASGLDATSVRWLEENHAVAAQWIASLTKILRNHNPTFSTKILVPTSKNRFNTLDRRELRSFEDLLNTAGLTAESVQLLMSFKTAGIIWVKELHYLIQDRKLQQSSSEPMKLDSDIWQLNIAPHLLASLNKAGITKIRHLLALLPPWDIPGIGFAGWHLSIARALINNGFEIPAGALRPSSSDCDDHR